MRRKSSEISGVISKRGYINFSRQNKVHNIIYKLYGYNRVISKESMSSSESSENGHLFEESPPSSPRGRSQCTAGRRGRPGSSRGRSGSSRGRSGSSRGRSRSRSGSRGRQRGRGRGRGTESSVQTRDTTVDLLTERNEKIKSEIANMEVEDLRQLCLEMASSHPGLVFDILHPAGRQPGGYHPPPGVNLIGWCVCSKCREMPTDVEKVCCGKAECITLIPTFNVLVLDEEVLAIGRIFRRDVLVYNDEGDRTKANRHQGYRQFIMWQHGKLGAGVRHVVPSCAVWAIKNKYPDPFGQYTGFVPSRFA